MANEVAVQQKQGIASFLSSEKVKENVMNVVGEKGAQHFISSVVSAVQTNPDLAQCTNSSILSAALLGHSLNLPPSPQLGFYYFVPYNNTKKITNAQGKTEEVKVKEATFQMSYRGYIQLAQRSGQYQKINATDIREGELRSYNPITEEIEFDAVTDFKEREKLPIIGYYAYFVLNNGFKKEIYWSKEQMDAHAKKYSMSYRKGWSSSFWSSNFDDMAKKTLLRQLISKWGMMSLSMENAYQGDMAVLDENGNPDYVDNVPDGAEPAVDVYADVVEADQVAIEDIEE